MSRKQPFGVMTENIKKLPSSHVQSHGVVESNGYYPLRIVDALTHKRCVRYTVLEDEVADERRCLRYARRRTEEVDV